MRKTLYAACPALALLLLCACGGGGANQRAATNGNGATANTGNAQGENGAASHPGTGTTETGSAPLAGPAHARPGGAPASSSSSSSLMGSGGEAIDTSKYDADVERLQKRAERNGASEADRTALAHAYLERANALTKARQYRSALGDYRRTLKYDPSNDEAKEMAGQIISILQSLGREVPKEGAEPTPLPFKQ